MTQASRNKREGALFSKHGNFYVRNDGENTAWPYLNRKQRKAGQRQCKAYGIVVSARHLTTYIIPG